MMDSEYMAVATDVFPAPVNPGATATIVAKMMASQITKKNGAYTETTHIHCN
jgi:hypothetical protein